MRHRSRSTINELRAAIDALPPQTKVAMLHGIRTNPIVVCAYSEDGAICPMLAAHRNGGRTNYTSKPYESFATAWDKFSLRTTRDGKTRRATERELLILASNLEASLLVDEEIAGIERTAVPHLIQSSVLAAAMSEHRALVAQREQAEQAEQARLDDEQQRRATVERRELDRELSKRREQRAAGRRSRREHAPVRPGDPDRSRELAGKPGWAWTKVVRGYDEYEAALARLESERDALRECETSERLKPERELVH